MILKTHPIPQGCVFVKGTNHMNSNSKTRILAECALLIALGTILAQVKLYELPNGDSVTAASMVPFILVSLRHGPRWGLLTGFANSLLQMLLGGLWPTPAGTATAMALEVLLDYLVPFKALWRGEEAAGHPVRRLLRVPAALSGPFSFRLYRMGIHHPGRHRGCHLLVNV